MKTLIAIALIVAIVAIFAGELVRVARLIVARIKCDEDTINRLTHTYDECENIAFNTYWCSKELFAQYYKEVLENNPKATPWDALEFCALEYDILNNNSNAKNH
jgi:hypothetical protein